MQDWASKRAVFLSLIFLDNVVWEVCRQNLAGEGCGTAKERVGEVLDRPFILHFASYLNPSRLWLSRLGVLHWRSPINLQSVVRPVGGFALSVITSEGS